MGNGLVRGNIPSPGPQYPSALQTLAPGRWDVALIFSFILQILLFLLSEKVPNTPILVKTATGDTKIVSQQQK